MPSIEQLWMTAQHALAAGDLDVAELAGRGLQAERHSASFEVLARVAMAREEHAEAVEILEQGVAVAPTAIPIWQLLGNTLSELGRQTEAWAAYEQAIAHAPGAAPSIRLNRAILQLRIEEPEAALRELDACVPGPLSALFADARITALLDAGRGEQALSFAATFDADPELEGVAHFHEAHAIAIWKVRQDPLAAATQLGKARLGGSPRALWLLRELWGEDLDEGVEYHVVGQAKTETASFEQAAVLVAADADAAASSARRLGDWLGWQDLAEIVEVGPIGPARSGFYEVAPRVFGAAE